MSTVHATANTEQEYKCVHCGADSVNIIREGADPRLKCNHCSGMFDASASKAAEAAGSIPDPAAYTPPEIEVPEAAKVDRGIRKDEQSTVSDTATKTTTKAGLSIPRNPDYVFISKNRRDVQYVSKKDLDKALLRWEAGDKKYDLYELTMKHADVKVEFS